ncbi:MAG: hypothetical protein IKO00_17830 [Oscillospiraceae bacterium]|jgi:sorbitol-specific phosphotransferase system component IIBC|nr:hypothetical protein [Oscillospiraceae bacterium]
MKRTQIFTLVMAIFWTIVGVLAVMLAARSSGLNTSMKIVLAFLAFVAIAGNWLRWYRSR